MDGGYSRCRLPTAAEPAWGQLENDESPHGASSVDHVDEKKLHKDTYTVFHWCLRMVSLGLNGFLPGSYTDPDMPLEVFVPPKMALAMGASPWFSCACESRLPSRWGAHIWLCLGYHC